MLLVRETRCGCDEVRHFGEIAIAFEDRILEIGDASIKVPVRSTGKPFILAALLDGPLNGESFSEAELAIMSSSHNGEEEHVRTLIGLLNRYSIPVDLVRCGSHEIWRSWSNPSQLGNNCSGKHAAFLIATQILGHALNEYANFNAPVQKMVNEKVGQYYGCNPESVGIDGCSLSTYAFKLDRLADTIRRFAIGELGPGASSIRNAHLKASFYLGGTDRLESYLNTRYGVVAKSGSDGVWTIGFPRSNVGIAGKVWGGNEAAVQLAILHIIKELDLLPIAGDVYLKSYMGRQRLSLTGEEVGRIEACFSMRSKS